MKSEHRHDLQTNELGKITEKLGSFMEVHGNRLMIGVCVVSLAASVAIYWVRTQRNSEASAWREMSTAIATGKAEDFYDVWVDHKGTPTGLWARVHEGESWLGQGVQDLFRNVELGTEHVKKARDAFQTVVDDRRAPAEVRERGLIGLGRALESLSDGSEADALKAYESLVKEFPDSIYKHDAEDRIAVLSKGSGQEFYAWFAKYPRPKTAAKGPHDKTGDDLIDEQFDTIRKLESLSNAGRKSADDAKSLELPGVDSPESDGTGKAGLKSDRDPDSEPKPDSVPEPESKPDADEKPAPK
jgi:hypothetical protein